MRKSSKLQTFLLSCLLGTALSHIVLLSPPYENSQHTNLHHPFQPPSHGLEKSFSWNWSWKQRRDTKYLRTPDTSLHKTSVSCFQVGVGEYWGACRHFWDTDSALSRNTLLQHRMKENESILHFTWSYSKSLPLSYKKSPLTSVLWAGKQNKERQGALDPV